MYLIVKINSCAEFEAAASVRTYKMMQMEGTLIFTDLQSGNNCHRIPVTRRRNLNRSYALSVIPWTPGGYNLKVTIAEG